MMERIDTNLPDALAETRALPHSREAERAVIGALLLDPEAIIGVSQNLQAQDFYVDAYGVIYGVMLDLYERRQPIDWATLIDELDRRDLLDSVVRR